MVKSSFTLGPIIASLSCGGRREFGTSLMTRKAGFSRMNALPVTFGPTPANGGPLYGLPVNGGSISGQFHERACTIGKAEFGMSDPSW
jgi:hypothetical protein